MRPPEGCSTPTIMRIVVVLPAPFGPRKPNSSPRLMCRSSGCTAVNLPYRFVTPSSRIIHRPRIRSPVQLPAPAPARVPLHHLQPQPPYESQELHLSRQSTDDESQMRSIGWILTECGIDRDPA